MAAASTSGPELRLVHEGHRVAVVEEVDELLLDVPVVHVDGDGPQLEGGEHRLDELDAVVRVDGDVVPLADALGGEVVGEPVGPILQLGEGDPPVAADEGGAVGHHVDGVLDEVGEVERHRGSRTRSRDVIYWRS